MANLRTIIVAGLIGCCAVPALAGDPYAAETAKLKAEAYQRTRAQVMDTTASIYFAVGCKVFQVFEEAYPLVIQVQNSIAAVNDSVVDKDYFTSIEEAKRRGAALAHMPGKCDWWHQHLDAVAAIRQSARIAAFAH